MLKETPTSLRAYFWFVTVFAVLPVVGQISEGKIDYVSASIGVLFGGIYGYVAFRMEHLLSSRPGLISGVLLLNLALAGLVSIIAVRNGRAWSTLPYLGVAFAVTAYLYTSVGRLSREAIISRKTAPYTAWKTRKSWRQVTIYS